MNDLADATRDELAAEVARLRTKLRKTQNAHETARVIVADNLWANRYRLQVLTAGDAEGCRPVVENIGREIVDALHGAGLIKGPVRDGEPCPRCGRPTFDYEVEPGLTIPACDCGPDLPAGSG